MCWYHRQNKFTMACADILLDRSLSIRKLLLAMNGRLGICGECGPELVVHRYDTARLALAYCVLKVNGLADLTTCISYHSPGQAG